MEKRNLSLRQNGFAWFFTILSIILAVFDALTTEIMINRGIVVEGNPLIAWLMSVLGVWWVIPKLFANFAVSFILFISWKHIGPKIAMAFYVSLYIIVLLYHSYIFFYLQ